ncbi:uncharacterized protein ZSWIM9-like [Rhinatrema bivittatum]|uniref:uncharacterized protein ZSWIM9-like n=1 Tax=Rhinatrema bivittatum TaxID=194408 RepID=UPI00112CC968|nr:uncharacterized protein ZSWIM9-like [Rhinatrema bivittatum]
MLHHKRYTLGADLPSPVTGSRLASLPCLSTKITNDISRKFLEHNDLSKLQHFHPAQFEDRAEILNELDSLFVSDPGAKVKLVFMENRMLVKNIFIMTSAMQDMAQRFPEYLYVDLLPHFGSHVDLYTVYCEDDNAEWKVCAKCLARKGQSEHLRFLMVSICQSIQNLTDQVKYVTVNPEIWEPLDLKPLVPFASLRYCMPQVLEILYERISDADSTAEAQIKNFLHILAHSCSPVFYNQYLNELKAACPAEFFQYYYETWHPHREMWIIKDSRSQIAESNICTLIKSKHQALRVNVDAASSLYCCLHLALNDSTTVLNATSASNLQESPSMPDTSLALALHQKMELPIGEPWPADFSLPPPDSIKQEAVSLPISTTSAEETTSAAVPFSIDLKSEQQLSSFHPAETVSERGQAYCHRHQLPSQSPVARYECPTSN